MSDRLAFMTPHHHAVRNFVVQELPRHAAPLSPTQIVRSLRLDVKHVGDLIEDLERHLFFLVRDARNEVSWAFPVTSDPTPHRLRFSTGERISGA
jgi:hypothetical protein